jgi:hypothetical protein
MSKLTETLRTVKVFNPFEFYLSYSDTPQLHIDYVPNGNARAFQYAHWAVCKGKIQLDPKGNRNSNWGRTSKRFDITHSISSHPRYARVGTFAECKQIALREAQDWANGNFGKRAWVKDPWGGYGDALFVADRLAALKAEAKAKAHQEESV